MSRVICFDLDGTLMPGSTDVKAIGSVVGHQDDADQAEREFKSGSIDNRVVAQRLAAHLAGVHLDDIRTALARTPRINGIQQVVDSLRSRGDHVMLASVTWSFFVRLFAEEVMPHFR